MKKSTPSQNSLYRSFSGLIAMVIIVAASATTIEASPQATELKRVPTKQVCMINNEFMSKKQIPVEVNGKVYYGCCQACYAALKSDEKTRYSVDPVSGKKVDKALAVIGALPDGKVIYFENEASFHSFSTSK